KWDKERTIETRARPMAASWKSLQAIKNRLCRLSRGKCLPLRGEVGGEQAVVEGAGDGLLDGGSFGFQPQRVAQQHRRAEEGRVGIGDAFAGDVRGRAVDRLIDTDLAFLTQRGGRQQA